MKGWTNQSIVNRFRFPLPATLRSVWRSKRGHPLSHNYRSSFFLSEQSSKSSCMIVHRLTSATLEDPGLPRNCNADGYLLSHLFFRIVPPPRRIYLLCIIGVWSLPLWKRRPKGTAIVLAASSSAPLPCKNSFPPPPQPNCERDHQLTSATLEESASTRNCHMGLLISSTSISEHSPKA